MASQNDAAQLWDPRSGRRIATLGGARANALAFSPDGRRLLSGNVDGSIAVHVIPTGRTVHRLALHHGPILSLDWSMDGRLVAAACQDGSVLILRPRTWRAARTILNPLRARKVPRVLGAPAGPVRFSPDGRRLAIVFGASRQGEPMSTESTATVWDAGTWTRPRILIDDTFANNIAVAFSPDGRQLATATATPTAEGQVAVWDVASISTRMLAAHARGTNAIVFLDSGKQLAAEDAPVVLFDVHTGDTVAVLSQRTSVYGMAATRGGRILVTGDAEGVIRLWNIPPLRPVRHLAWPG